MASGRMLLAWLLGAGWFLGPAYDVTGRLAAGEPLPDQGQTPGVWRTASHDGATCLQLLLFLSGRKVDYADVTAALEASGRGHSLAGLRDAAQRLGLQAAVYHWRPSQLVHAPGPVIVGLDHYNGQGGYFTLVFRATEDKCYLVDGPTATIQEVGAENFRHAWSGYVLAAAPPHSRQVELLSCGIAVLILAGYGWFRARRALAMPVAGARSQVP